MTLTISDDNLVVQHVFFFSVNNMNSNVLINIDTHTKQPEFMGFLFALSSWLAMLSYEVMYQIPN